MNSNRSLGHGIPTGIATSILRFDWLIVAIVVVLTVLAIYQLSKASFGNSLLEVFMEDLSRYREYVQATESMGGDSGDLIYVAAHVGSELFTPQKLTALRRASRELESLPEVIRAYSYVDVPRLVTLDRLNAREMIARIVARQQLLDGKVPTKETSVQLNWPRSTAQQKRINLVELRQELLDDPTVAGTLLSRDGEKWGIILSLSSGRDLTISQQIHLRERIVNVIEKNGLGDSGVHLAGLVVSQGWLFSEMYRGLLVICPLVLLAMSTTVFLIFRQIAAAAIATLIAVLATIWALAFTMVVFGEINMVVIAAAPPLIIVISTSDYIHLTSAFRMELALGQSRNDALISVICNVGGAFVLTSVTTMIGFAALATVPVPATRHFAVASAVGVAAAFLLQSLGPIAFRRMRLPRPPAMGRANRIATRLLGGILTMCRLVSTRHPRLVILASVCLIALATLGIFGKRFSADFPLRFPEGHPLRSSSNFFNQHFSGSSNVELMFRMPENRSVDPFLLSTMAVVEERLLAIPEVCAVDSVLKPIRALNRVVDFETADGLPPSVVSVDSSLRFIESKDQQSIRTFISPQRNQLRVFVRIAPTDFMDVASLAKQMESVVREQLPADIVVSATGPFVIVGQTVERIIGSQLRGNWICVIAVTGVMALALGSLRIGILSQLPNLVPLAILVGILAVQSKRIDSDLLGLPMIALGIAVDDTIHFLHRYRLQLFAGESRSNAIESTLRYTGHAIIWSTLVLCVGLAPCALSNYLGVWMMGTLLVFTLACGLIADLLLVPAMIEIGLIRWREIE
jgi:predicted RND superfamily exporter protein